MTGLFDPGLQPERTELAWRRTALAIGVGSLVALRLLPDALGSNLWMLPGAGGLLIAVLLWWAARRRHRAVYAALTRSGDRAVLPGAGPLVALAVFAFAVGLVSAGVVILVVLGR